MKTLYTNGLFIRLEPETEMEESILKNSFREPVARFDLTDKEKPFLLIAPKKATETPERLREAVYCLDRILSAWRGGRDPEPPLRHRADKLLIAIAESQKE